MFRSTITTDSQKVLKTAGARTKHSNILFTFTNVALINFVFMQGFFKGKI